MTKARGLVQRDGSHYRFGSYAFEGRFVSYYFQINEVLALSPTSVLELGCGDRTFGGYLKNTTSLTYVSTDIALDLHPDVVGDALRLPFANGSFDVVCAFEVLEHLPFSEFDHAVTELCRVARNHIVLSLPHFGPMLSLDLKIPLMPRLRVALKIPLPKAHRFNEQHYWEIGKRGFPVTRIREVLKRHGRLTKDFVPFASEYHHFFVLALRDRASLPPA